MNWTLAGQLTTVAVLIAWAIAFVFAVRRERREQREFERESQKKNYTDDAAAFTSHHRNTRDEYGGRNVGVSPMRFKEPVI